MRDGIRFAYSVNLNLAFKNKNITLMMWKNCGGYKADGQPSLAIQLKNLAIKNSNPFQRLKMNKP